MRIKLALSILFTFIIISCIKRTQVSGVVYSIHNVPVPNVWVGWEEYRESSYPEKVVYEKVKTNDKGEYTFSFHGGRKKFQYQVRCVCDSGSKKTIVNPGKTNKIDLRLE